MRSGEKAMFNECSDNNILAHHNNSARYHIKNIEFLVISRLFCFHHFALKMARAVESSTKWIEAVNVHRCATATALY